MRDFFFLPFQMSHSWRLVQDLKRFSVESRKAFVFSLVLVLFIMLLDLLTHALFIDNQPVGLFTGNTSPGLTDSVRQVANTADKFTEQVTIINCLRHYRLSGVMALMVQPA